MRTPLVQQVFAAIIFFFCMIAGVTLASAGILSPSQTLLGKLYREGFDNETINRIFSDERVELYPQILERRAKGINYFHRKFGLLTRRSVDEGRQVLSQNRRLFQELEGLYGVEKEAVVAIFRIETNLGRHTEAFPIFNSLLTIAAIPNRRSEWAEGELVHLLVMCRKVGKDPLSIKGSWAGAFGLCQFIPSSFLAYGVDGDGDEIVDLFNFADAMASIANYLKGSGWKNSSMTQKKKAIHAYNHCDSYVKAVVAYTKACKGESQRRHGKRYPGGYPLRGSHTEPG